MLKPYQKDLLKKVQNELVKGFKNILIQSPTGSGKSYIIKALANCNLNHIILTHRQEIYKSFNGCNVEMVETFYNQIKKTPSLLDFIDLFLMDEVHRSEFDKVIDFINKNSKEKPTIFGFTATPIRTGNQKPLKELWESIVLGPTPEELIKEGNICPTINYAPKSIDISQIKKTGGDYDLNSQAIALDTPEIYQSLVDNYKRLTPNTKTILFTPNIKSAEKVCEVLQRANLQARSVDSNLSDKNRKKVFEWFENADNGILVNCSIATTGYDCPSIQTVILFRATTSLALYNQMVGRGTRTYPNKTHCTVLDFGRNVERFGAWEYSRNWSLEKPRKKKIENLGKICPKCSKVNPNNKLQCVCGYVYPIKKTKAITNTSQKIDLERLNNPKPKQKIGYYLRQAQSKAEVFAIIANYGYKPGFYHTAKKIWPNIETLR